MSTPLTYSEGLTRQAQALAHMGALDAVLPLYAHAYQRDPMRFRLRGAPTPTPDEMTQALQTIRLALRAMRTADFQETTP